ncbi:hypothetical protein [Streptomyces sp. NPDC001401]|uniref:hypothetical protein n=1 Tax=Streptomyces sp. NPDC001401 TaxID=3364570 RepID=UPI0036CD709C
MSPPDLAARYPNLQVRGEQTADAPDVGLLAAARSAGLLVVGARGSGDFDGLAVGLVAPSGGCGSRLPRRADSHTAGKGLRGRDTGGGWCCPGGGGLRRTPPGR